MSAYSGKNIPDVPDKRRSPRVSFKCEVVVKTSSGETVYQKQTFTENISCNGVGVLLDKRLDIFLPVEVFIFCDDGAVIKSSGEVRNVAEYTDTLNPELCFITGILLTGIAEEDMDRLEDIVERFLEEES